MEEVLQTPVDRKQNRGFILGSLSFAHGIAHLYDQGLPVFMPTIADSMGLGKFQVAALFGIRQAGFGVVNLGGGVFVDMLKSQWGLILTACMIWAAIAQVAVGAAPNFALLVIAVTLISLPGSVWHLPATAALSQRFPDRRGFAISMHSFGANIGNVLGPLLAGALLAILFYRTVLFIYAAPALAISAFVWWSLRDIGREGGPSERKSFRVQFQATKAVLKNPIVLSLVLASALRGVALNSLFQWTPFYLEKELGMGPFMAGVHFALLTGMGIAAAPVLGVLSDKFNRKLILIPGLAVAAVLALLVVSTGDSIWLPLTLGGLGIFTFSLQQIILAAVLDVTGRGTEAATTGFIFGIDGIISGATTFIVPVLIAHLGGYGSIFYFAGILTALSGFLVMAVPMAPKRAAPISAA